jgi:hypothetical protein
MLDPPTPDPPAPTPLPLAAWRQLASPLSPPLPAFPPLPPLPAVFTCVFSDVLEFEWLWLDACEELAELLCALRAEGAGAAGLVVL